MKKLFGKYKPYRSMIKHIKKTRRRAYWKLSIPWWYLLLLLSAFLCFAGSYLCIDNNAWTSSLLQSCGAGIITGVVVFVLGNIRGQTKDNIERAVLQLSELYKIQKTVYDALPELSVIKLTAKKYDYVECTFQMLDAAYDYLEAITKVDFYIIKSFMKDTGANVDELKSKISQLRDLDISEDLTYSDAYRLKTKVIEIIQVATNWFEDRLSKLEIQQQQLRQYPF